MQQPITRRDVYEPTATVVINGSPVDVASVSVDRALPDPLARAELRSAEAQIVAVDGPDVTSTIATPWDPASQWPPAKEAPASVSFDTGSGPVAALTNGRVTLSEGGTDERPVYIEVLDQYQSLDKTISWGPIAEATPSESEATVARYVGLQSIHVTDRILRHCGWYATPPNPGYQALSVPAQGSMWPETGTVVTSQAQSGAYPGWLLAPWGLGVSDVDATYQLGGNYSIQNRGRMELTAMTAPRAGSGTSRIDVLAGGMLLARMQWADATAHVLLRNSGGTMSTVASIPRSNGLLYATVEYVSSTSVYVTLRSGGQTVGASASVPSVVTTEIIRDARIVANSVSGGFQVAFPSTAGTLEDWEPNAVIYPRPASANRLHVLPPVEGKSCVDLLAQQCEAECATYWIDELGILRWWDLDRLETQSTVATVTSDDDITRAGFRWSNDPSTVKSRVGVDWREPLRDWSWRTSVDLWQGSGQSIQTNTATVADPTESWINVPDDEVWLLPDLTPSRVGDSYSDFNIGWGTWYGGITAVGTSVDTDHWAQLDGSLLWSIEKVTDSAFKTSLIWTGAKDATQQTLDAESRIGTGLVRRRCDFDLPIIRGKAKFTFTDRVTYSAQSGPVTAPEHTIDAGFWIQLPEQAQYTADYAGARMTIQQPTISELPLVMAPGVQIGDVIEAVESDVSRLTIRGVVIRDSRSLAAGIDMRHKIAIRPTHVSRNGITWAEWGAAMNGKTWSTWGTEQQPKTWSEWGTDPLAE